MTVSKILPCDYTIMKKRGLFMKIAISIFSRISQLGFIGFVITGCGEPSKKAVQAVTPKVTSQPTDSQTLQKNDYNCVQTAQYSMKQKNGDLINRETVFKSEFTKTIKILNQGALAEIIDKGKIIFEVYTLNKENQRPDKFDSDLKYAFVTDFKILQKKIKTNEIQRLSKISKYLKADEGYFFAGDTKPTEKTITSQEELIYTFIDEVYKEVSFKINGVEQVLRDYEIVETEDNGLKVVTKTLQKPYIEEDESVKTILKDVSVCKIKEGPRDGAKGADVLTLLPVQL
jgi:hypothetical protein